MLRTFEEHAVRETLSLDGLWDFVIAPERRDRARLPRLYNRRIYVPSAWETVPGLENYRGRAWLRKQVPARDGRALRLVFGGVSHTGTVYVNGRCVGSHYDAFTPWDVLAPAARNGFCEVVVVVDNSFGEHSALHIESDFYTYGGITRPATAEYVPEVFIERLHAIPVLFRGRWSLRVAVRLRNWDRRAARRRLTVSAGGAILDMGAVTVPAGARRSVTGQLSVPDAKPWTAAHPVLYRLEARLDDGARAVDDLVDRVGFREVRVAGARILLNGKPLRLRGYNRHEDHGQFGCALPVEAMQQDLLIMRDLGCNFIRTSHYPNDRRFLDLCDEMGFYIWEESHARGVDFKHPKYREQIAAATTEMVDWHRNHPSIVIWGSLNECDSATPAGRREHARVLNLLRRLDGSRPVTFASNKSQHDISLGLADIVSWNRYDAWYGGLPQDIAPRLRKMLKWLHAPKNPARGKPVIMSEFGAAGLYGCRQQRRNKWSEEYQADCLDESLRVYLNHPMIAGASIWQFCDCRITQNYKGWGTRARTMNNKGTLDEYRRPKLCYEVVKRRMHEAARYAGTRRDQDVV